jgi:SNF2 family DNA or RNA helicase
MMVNYDLPWNPNRIEQRFGRIHRIGQQRPCHLWNLVAHQTREGQVFKRLFEKIEQQRGVYGDQVYAGAPDPSDPRRRRPGPRRVHERDHRG